MICRGTVVGTQVQRHHIAHSQDASLLADRDHCAMFEQQPVNSRHSSFGIGHDPYGDFQD